MADLSGPTPQQLGQLLEGLREQAELSIDELAKRAGLDRNRVVLIESGVVPQDLVELMQYAAGLGMPLSKIFRIWENLN